MTWQPIDTAPKDGTEILATDGSTIDIAVLIEFPGTNRYKPGYFIVASNTDWVPTHWQPLPDHSPLPEETP